MPESLHIAEYKLTDLLSSAGATIGIIIAGTIFLQFMSTKTIELVGRYREMTCEYRGGVEAEVRRSLLQSQLRIYRRRLRLMHWASRLAALGLLSFLVAFLAGGLSLMFPPVYALKWVGTAGLFVGLIMIGVAVGFELAEDVLGGHELGDEVGDLDDPARC